MIKNAGRKGAGRITHEWRTHEAFFRKIFTSHFIARVRKGCWSVACEKMLETEHKTSYFDPTVMIVTLCLSCSLDVGVYSIGGFRGPPRSGVAFPYHIWSLGVWKSAGNCFDTPNSTELNNNSTPTRSPTGSLNRMFNRHQAEITVMQFRGYSLPVHHCNGTMGPSPFPIS